MSSTDWDETPLESLLGRLPPRGGAANEFLNWRLGKPFPGWPAPSPGNYVTSPPLFPLFPAMAEARKVMLMSSDGEGTLGYFCVWCFVLCGPLLVFVVCLVLASLWVFVAVSCPCVLVWCVSCVCTLRSHRVKFVGCSEGVQRVGFLWLVSFRLGLSNTHTLTHF